MVTRLFEGYTLKILLIMFSWYLDHICIKAENSAKTEDLKRTKQAWRLSHFAFSFSHNTVYVLYVVSRGRVNPHGRQL